MTAVANNVQGAFHHNLLAVLYAAPYATLEQMSKDCQEYARIVVTTKTQVCKALNWCSTALLETRPPSEGALTNVTVSIPSPDFPSIQALQNSARNSNSTWNVISSRRKCTVLCAADHHLTAQEVELPTKNAERTFTFYNTTSGANAAFSIESKTGSSPFFLDTNAPDRLSNFLLPHRISCVTCGRHLRCDDSTKMERERTVAALFFGVIMLLACGFNRRAGK